MCLCLTGFTIHQGFYTLHEGQQYPPGGQSRRPFRLELAHLPTVLGGRLFADMFVMRPAKAGMMQATGAPCNTGNTSYRFGPFHHATGFMDPIFYRRYCLSVGLGKRYLSLLSYCYESGIGFTHDPPGPAIRVFAVSWLPPVLPLLGSSGGLFCRANIRAWFCHSPRSPGFQRTE